MARFSPVPIRERYANTALRREEGRNILVNLPMKSRGELEDAARVLAGQSCRECSSCCSGGFSFTKEDPHFEQIMGGMMADRKRFVLRKSRSALSKERTFLVFVPFGKKACGFLDGQAAIYSELHFAETLAPDDENAFFGCKMYATRPSICKSYPFVWDMFDESNRVEGWDNSFAAIDPNCLVMWKLGNQGIGHFTLSEIDFLIERGRSGGESMLSSLGFSLSEIKRRVEAKKAWGKIFRSEEGEEVYPLNYNEISHPVWD